MDNDKSIKDIVEIVAPDANIVSMSQPEPALLDYNVVGLYETQEASRNAVLALESFEADDASIGLVALGHEARPSGLQPQDSTISSTTLSRAAKGAAIGAVVSAIIIGGLSALFTTGGIAVGAAVGGALFGAFVGGVWGAFVRFGGSDAYRQSFVDNEHGVTLVSLHTSNPGRASEARARLSLESMSAPMVFRREGERLWADDAEIDVTTD